MSPFCLPITFRHTSNIRGAILTPHSPALSDPAERQAFSRLRAVGANGVAWPKARTGYVGSASPDGLDPTRWTNEGGVHVQSAPRRIPANRLPYQAQPRRPAERLRLGPLRMDHTSSCPKSPPLAPSGSSRLESGGLPDLTSDHKFFWISSLCLVASSSWQIGWG
jgi:hypothetical protein